MTIREKALSVWGIVALAVIIGFATTSANKAPVITQDAAIQILNDASEDTTPPDWPWSWQVVKQQDVRLSAKSSQVIWEAIKPTTGRDRSSLVRIMINAGHPVHLGFFGTGVIPSSDPRNFEHSDSICQHLDVTVLVATCLIPEDDTRRILIVQDANQGFLTAGQNGTKGTNLVQAKMANYVCTGCKAK